MGILPLPKNQRRPGVQNMETEA